MEFPFKASCPCPQKFEQGKCSGMGKPPPPNIDCLKQQCVPEWDCVVSCTPKQGLGCVHSCERQKAFSSSNVIKNMIDFSDKQCVPRKCNCNRKINKKNKCLCSNPCEEKKPCVTITPSSTDGTGFVHQQYFKNEGYLFVQDQKQGHGSQSICATPAQNQHEHSTTEVPFTACLPAGFGHGKSLIVRGKPCHNNAWFAITFLNGHELLKTRYDTPTKIAALQIQARLDNNKVVLNTFDCQGWGKEERKPIDIGVYLDGQWEDSVCYSDFEEVIYFNGNWFTRYCHRVDKSIVSHYNFCGDFKVKEIVYA